jgi:regulator of protease activity HflC (stomatin/prohibitin superfamily)
MLFMAAVFGCAFMLPGAPNPLQTRTVPPQMIQLPGFPELPDLSSDSGPELLGKLAAGLAALLVLSSLTPVVQPGELAVLTTLGSVTAAPLQPGFHIVPPLSTVEFVSVKTSLTEESTTVPTKEGLSIELDTALLYRLDPESVQSLIISVGSDFERVVIKPEVRSIIRGLTSEVEAKALYTSGRGELQRRLKEELSEALSRRGIIVEDVLLKSVKLPDQLVKAVELKAESEQAAQRMEFVLAKERQEAERKKIEAQGIADFQAIVSKGISPELLKWKGIEATERLADSPNAKMVIMGNGKDSLPVILNGASS